MVICIDFDGCVVTHAFPEIGKDIGAVPVLKKLIESGHELILYTCRSNFKYPNLYQSSDYLSKAVQWFKDNNIKLSGVNINPDVKAMIENLNSPQLYLKPFADIYIDDKSLCMPLRSDLSLSPHPFVDWFVLDNYLTAKGIITVETPAIKEGDVFYSFEMDGYDSVDSIRPYTVTKVKRKYFFVDTWPFPFSNITLQYKDKDWCRNNRHLFRTKEDAVYYQRGYIAKDKIVQKIRDRSFPRYLLRYFESIFDSITIKTETDAK
jgi:hypothetical protein